MKPFALFSLLFAVLSGTLPAQTRHFRDDFNRNTLGAAYTGFGWNIQGGQLHTDLGGSGEAITAASSTLSDYSIQSAIRGLDPGTGPSPGDRFCLVLGANEDRSNELRVCIYVSFGTHIDLIHTFKLVTGQFAEQILGSDSVSFNSVDWYKVTILRNSSTGATSVWFTHEDEPLGSPLYQGNDLTSTALGHFGWRIERESPPLTNPFFADFLSVTGR